MNPARLQLAGETLELWPQRAAYAPAHNTLLVADAHIGKAASFRQLGVPVPEATTQGNLQRLSHLVKATAAQRIVFLGDLLHSAAAHNASTVTQVQHWREQHAYLHLTLVMGNHDAHAGEPPKAWGVQVVQEGWRLGPWALVHHPQTVAGAYTLAGHVHPAVRLNGKARQSLRLPCFHFTANGGTLPAFGEFTGSHVVKPQKSDQIFLVLEDEVRRLKF